jgi:hypothetical protein
VTKSEPPKQMAPVVVIPAPLPFQIATPEPTPSPVAPTVPLDLAMLAPQSAPPPSLTPVPEPVPSPLLAPPNLDQLIAADRAAGESMASLNLQVVEDAESDVEVQENPLHRRGFLQTMSEVIDPRILQKMLPQTRERRRHLAKYVKGVVAVCAAVCVLAGVSAAISASGGEAKAAPSRTAAIALDQRNGLARMEVVRAPAPLPEAKPEKAEKRIAAASPKSKRR